MARTDSRVRLARKALRESWAPQVWRVRPALRVGPEVQGTLAFLKLEAPAPQARLADYEEQHVRAKALGGLLRGGWRRLGQVKPRSLYSSCLLLVFACGGTPPPTPANVVVTPVSPSPIASTASAEPATPTRQAASQDMRSVWPYGDGARVVLYADVGGLFGTELGRTFTADTLQLAAGSLSEDQMRCVRGAAAAIHEVAFGADEHDGLIIATYDQAVFNPSSCLGSSVAPRAPVEWAKEAYELEGGLLVVEPGLLLFGDKSAARRALAKRGTPAPLPAGLSLGPDEYVSWTFHIAGKVNASGKVVASSERFRIDVRGDIEESDAAEFERVLGEVQNAGTFPGVEEAQRELAGKVLRSLTLKRDGGHIDGAFDLREPPSEQARDLGLFASLGVVGVRQYLVSAKTAEARNSLGQIARDYAAWWEQEGPPGAARAKKKLFSLPPVPRTVPKGVKYQSSPADWKPWNALKFTLDSPQYYQYEVRAAKDGDSADIIARGDLDGDGKTSLFTVAIRVDRKHGQMNIAPSVQETDPTE